MNRPPVAGRATAMFASRPTADFDASIPMLSSFAPLLLLATVPNAPAVSGPPQGPAELIVQIHYDPALLPGSPKYDEALANIVYPLGKGPDSVEPSGDAMPVLINLRGGNNNVLTVGNLALDPQVALAPPAGMVGIFCNYHEVTIQEDFRAAGIGVGRLVQHLRENADEYNIDPNAITIAGRSFGGLTCYATGLLEDQVNPGSAVPQEQQSSRPDYIATRVAISIINCFSDTYGTWTPKVEKYFFPGQSFLNVSEDERLRDSPYRWLLNPQEFNRTRTPPICMVYRFGHDHVCGEVADVHSGLFGDVMFDAVTEYAVRTGDRSYRQRSRAIDLDANPDPTGLIVDWIIERLADDRQGLYMLPPVGSIAPAGGDLLIEVRGAVPGSQVSLVYGENAGVSPIAGCTQLDVDIDAAISVGMETANSAGVALFTVTTPGALLGQTRLIQAYDRNTCEKSNVWRHVYY